MIKSRGLNFFNDVSELVLTPEGRWQRATVFLEHRQSFVQLSKPKLYIIVILQVGQSM